MSQVYQSHGVCFRFPDDWELSENEQDNETRIHVAGPDTSFWSLTLLHGRPEADDVVETAIEVFREEYDDLDIYPIETELCQQRAVGKDIEFVCLELINCARIRAFQTGEFTAFVLFQATDRDLPEARAVFENIMESLTCPADNKFEDSLFPEPEILP